MTHDVAFRISIIAYTKEEVEDHDKKVTFYQISVSNPMQNWKIKRRYNEFHELNEHLAFNYKTLPKLPPKSVFLLNDSSTEKRKSDLEKYLTELLELEGILLNVYFVAFLKLETYFPEFLTPVPLVMCKYETVNVLTFTDINYEEGRLINYALCSKGITKPSSSVPSMKAKEPAQGLTHKSILNGFKFDENHPVNLFQDKKIIKSFDLKAHCLQYFPEAAVIICGFSEGLISVYKEEKKIKQDDEYQLSSVAKIKAGSDRITKIILNKKKGILYAVARSNKIKIVDMASWSVSGGFKIGTGPIVAIHMDEAYDLGVSTTEDGKMLIIDMMPEMPVVKKTLNITNKGKISCMDCDIEAGKIVCAVWETGDIYIVDIEFPFTAVGVVYARNPSLKSFRVRKGT